VKRLRKLTGGLVALCPVALAILSPATATAARCSAAPGHGLTLANVASHGQHLIAVGSDGLIAASTEPTRWRVEPTPVRHALRGVAWSGRRWIVVGDVGTILARAAGKWQAASGIPSASLRGIAAGGGRVFAAGTAGTVEASSAAGRTWQPAASGTANTLWGGTAAGSTLALSGVDSTVVQSAAGTAFAPVPTFPRPTDSTEAPRPFLWQLGANGRQVVAVGDFGAILEGTLAGGLRAVRSPTDEILRGVAHAGRTWVAVGSGGVVLHSRDGVHWVLGSSPTTADLRGVTHTPEGWVAVGDQGTVIYSRDGRHWQIGVSAMPCALLGLAKGRGWLVAVGGSGRVLRSRDGRRWQPARRPTRQDLYGIVRGPGRFVAVGSDGALLTSGRGVGWRKRRTGTALNLHTAFWTGGEYLAGGDRGLVLSSRDGTRWRRIPFPAFHSVRGFATDGRNVVAAGAGTIARRPGPGRRWELESAGFQHFQTSIAYGSGRFVIVGHNGQALASTDGGGTWTAGKSGVEVNLDTVIWTGAGFLATGEGTAIFSPEGLAWAQVPIPTHFNLRALVPKGANIIGVGDGGVRNRLSRRDLGE
jgi:hypothetical protein